MTMIYNNKYNSTDDNNNRNIDNNNIYCHFLASQDGPIHCLTSADRFLIRYRII